MFHTHHLIAAIFRHNANRNNFQELYNCNGNSTTRTPSKSLFHSSIHAKILIRTATAAKTMAEYGDTVVPADWGGAAAGEGEGMGIADDSCTLMKSFWPPSQWPVTLQMYHFLPEAVRATTSLPDVKPSPPFGTWQA